MTQDQFLRLQPLRHHLEKLQQVGSLSLPHDHAQILQDVHKELFGGNFNAWCQSCLTDAMNAVFSQFDKYQAADAPIVLTSNQSAEVPTAPEPAPAKPKRARKP